MRIYLLLIMISLLIDKSWAQANSDDISLPADLQKVKVQAVDDSSIFDDCRIHGGASLMNSYQDIGLAPGVRERGGIRGFQLNIGIDLFSPHWITEGDLLYFPDSQINNTRISSNAFELRLLYDTALFEAITFHLGPGIASRSYTVRNNQYGDRSFGSGATVLVTGLDYWPSGNLSLGVELSDHLPLASGDDPSSIDLGIRVNGHF